MNKIKCPRCDDEMKVIGRCAFCENKKCTVYNIRLSKNWKKIDDDLSARLSDDGIEIGENI